MAKPGEWLGIIVSKIENFAQYVDPEPKPIRRMNMANPNKWIIEQGSGVGADLDGLKIKKTGSNYELYAVVATTPIPAQGNPVNFTNVTWDEQAWNLSLPANITPGQNAVGTWTLLDDDGRDVPGTPQSGDFTAQADDDMDADEVASSATA